MIEALASRRAAGLALAAATIAAGLVLQRFRHGLPHALADVLGDALWALMAYGLVAAAAPAMRPLPRAVVALSICWAVEFGQLHHAPWLDGWRDTTLGRLALGSGFDPRDLAAYALGVALGFGLDSASRTRHTRARTRR